MPRLILLAGMPTAGAARIQEALLRNEAPLARLGLRLVQTGREGPRATENDLAFKEPAHGSWAELRDETAAARSTDDTFILANSGAWALEIDSLTLLADAFVGFDVACVTYFVEQTDHLQRALLHTQRRPDRAIDFDSPDVFDEWASTKLPSLDYLSVAKRMTSVFSSSRFHARAYNLSAFPDNDVVLDFFSLLGIPETAELDLEARPEMVLTPNLARVLRLHGPALAESSRQADVLDLALRMSEEEATGSSFLSQGQLDTIRGRFAESNRRFFGTYIDNVGAFDESPAVEAFDPAAIEAQHLHLKDALQKWVRLGDRGWNGKMGMARRLFSKGWDISRSGERIVARQTSREAEINFRLGYRRSAVKGANDAIRIQLVQNDTAANALSAIAVNGQPLGDLDLNHDHITIPSDLLGPFDEVQISCTQSSTDQPRLEIVDLVLG